MQLCAGGLVKDAAAFAAVSCLLQVHIHNTRFCCCWAAMIPRYQLDMQLRVAMIFSQADLCHLPGCYSDRRADASCTWLAVVLLHRTLSILQAG
jgi:hypothetical protein